MLHPKHLLGVPIIIAEEPHCFQTEIYKPGSTLFELLKNIQVFYVEDFLPGPDQQHLSLQLPSESLAQTQSLLAPYKDFWIAFPSPDIAQAKARLHRNLVNAATDELQDLAVLVRSISPRVISARFYGRTNLGNLATWPILTVNSGLSYQNDLDFLPQLKILWDSPLFLREQPSRNMPIEDVPKMFHDIMKFDDEAADDEAVKFLTDAVSNDPDQAEAYIELSKTRSIWMTKNLDQLTYQSIENAASLAVQTNQALIGLLSLLADSSSEYSIQDKNTTVLTKRGQYEESYKVLSVSLEQKERNHQKFLKQLSRNLTRLHHVRQHWRRCEDSRCKVLKGCYDQSKIMTLPDSTHMHVVREHKRGSEHEGRVHKIYSLES